MAPHQDLTLPRSTSNNDRHRGARGIAGVRYTQAVYSILPLDRNTMDNLVDRLNKAEDIGYSSCQLAPQFDFANHPLRDVYDYHLRIRDQDNSVHPLYFLVAISANWENDGVLIVHLNTGQDGEEDRVGKARWDVEWAYSCGLNVDIGFLHWEDLMEMEEQKWGDRAVSREPELHQPRQPVTEPPRFQYACFSLVEKAIQLPQKLEPNLYDTPVEHRRIIIGGNYSSVAGRLSDVVRLFPWFCKSHPETHRQMAILADKPDFEGDGVLLLRFDWDGNVDAHDGANIIRLNLNYEQIQRVPASRAVAELDSYCRDNGLPQAYSSYMSGLNISALHLT